MSATFNKKRTIGQVEENTESQDRPAKKQKTKNDEHVKFSYIDPMLKKELESVGLQFIDEIK